MATPVQSDDGISAVTEPSTRLNGRMGVFSLAFSVLAFNGPAVVFLGFIPVCIMLGNGIGTPVAFLICGGVIALLAWGLTTMARQYPTPGGFYAFITAGLGRIPGLASGFAATMCYFLALLSAYPLAGSGMSAVVHGMLGGPEVPWWVWAIPVWLLTSVLGYLNIAFSARLLAVFLTCELILIVIYDIAVAVHGGAEGFSLEPFTAPAFTSGSLSVALMLGIGLYGGFDATVIFRDEVRDPNRTIPRATFLTVGLLAGMYAITAYMFINGYGVNAVLAAVEADPLGVTYASLETYVGRWALDAAALLLFTSAFALIVAAHNITSRYIFNLSNDGIVHRSLGIAHPKYMSPHKASVIVTALTVVAFIPLVLAGVGPDAAYARLAGVYTYTLVILLVGVSAAIGVYLLRNKKSVGPAIASLVVSAFMTVILVLATLNFDIISGATGTLEVVLLLLIYAVIAAGAILAAIYRLRRPEVYAKIGRQDVM